MAESLGDLLQGLRERPRGSGSVGGGLSSARARFPASTGSDESFKKLMAQLETVRRGRSALTALGGKESDYRGGQGLADYLLNQRTGIISAPARFVSAGLLDIFGYDDPELRSRDPLQSAIDSARGEFAITGGDIFKIEDDDSWNARLAKYAGALAFDVTLDPLTWVGPVNLASRKGAAVLAVRQGGKLLDDATSILVRNGGDSAKLVDTLFNRSRTAQAADIQRRSKLLGGAGTPLDILQADVKTGLIPEAVKRRVAGQEFGLIIGESLLTGGRAQVRRELTGILGSEKLVDDLFRQLPDEIAGGLFLKNPISGRPIARIAGGQGRGGDVAEAANRLRLDVSASGAGKVVSERFSGQYGKAWQAVRKELSKGTPDAGRTLLREYVELVDGLRAKGVDVAKITGKYAAVLAGARPVAREITEEQDTVTYLAALKSGFFSPSAPVADVSPAAQQGFEAANEIRRAMDEAHAELKRLGYPIGDLGPDWSPLILTDEEVARRAATGVRDPGVGRASTQYNPSGRKKEADYIPNPDERARAGYSIPNTEGGVWLNAPAANVRAGRVKYQEDPLIVAEKYLQWAGRTIAAERFVQAGLRSGLLFKFPRVVETLLDELKAVQAMSAAARTSPAARAKVVKMRDLVRQQMRELVDAGGASRIQAVDSVVDAFTSAVNELAEATSRLAGRSLDDIRRVDPVLARQVEAAQELVAEAREVMFETLRRAATGAGDGYGDRVVAMADLLTSSEMTAARLITDIDQLDKLMASVGSLKEPAAMGVIGDLYTVYRNLRDVLSVNDLAELGAARTSTLADVPLTRRAITAGPAAEAAREKLGIRAIGSGIENQDVILPRSMADIYASDAVAQTLESMYRMESNPNEWQKWLSNVYDPLYLVWKSAATVLRGPAYTMVNTVGGLANNYYFNVSFKAHRQAAAMVTAMNKITKRLQREMPTKSYSELLPQIRDELSRTVGSVRVGDRSLVDLYMDFLEAGGHMSSRTFFEMSEIAALGVRAPQVMGSGAQAASLLGTARRAAPETVTEKGVQKFANFMLDNPIAQGLSDMAQSSEMFVRFAAYIEGFERYGNLNAALDVVYMLHFPYQDLSSAERWVKRLAPFYTWSRYNVPLQMRAIFTAPSQVRKIFAAQENAETLLGADSEQQWLNEYLPDYLAVKGGFVSRFTFGGNHLALFPRTPIVDLNELFEIRYWDDVPILMPRRQQLVNNLGPAFVTAIEATTGRSFSQGRRFDTIQDFVEAQAKSWFPTGTQLYKLASAVGLPVDKEKRISNLMQVLGGGPYSAATIREGTLRWQTVERSAALSKQVKRAAADANVDIDWLRKQVSDGVRPDVLANMIASGQGSPERLELQRRLAGDTGARKDPRNYEEILRRLERG